MIKFLVIIILIYTVNSDIPDQIANAKNENEKVDILIDASNEKQLMNEVAIEYALAAKKLSNKLNDQEKIIKSNKNLATLYSRDFQIDKAIDLWFEIFQISESNNNELLLIESYKNLGNLYFQKNDLKEAASYYLIGIKFARDEQQFEHLADFYYDLGEINFTINSLDKAINYYNSAIESYRQIKNKNNLSLAYVGKAKSFLKRNEINLAKISIDSCLNVMNEDSPKGEKAYCLNIAGKIYYENDDYSKSIDYYKKALLLAEEIMDKKGIAKINKNISELFYKEGDIPTSKFYASNALSQSKALQDNELIKESSQILSDIFHKLGKPDSAYHYLKISSNYSKKLFDIEKQKIVSDLLTKYQAEETERKNKLLSDQIALERSKNLNNRLIWGFSLLVAIGIILFIYYRYRVKNKANKSLLDKNKKIEEQSLEMKKLNDELTNRNEEIETINKNLIESESELRESNATKDKFFSIIAHDLKNPISGILMSSDLIMNYSDKLEKSKIVSTVKDINSAVKRLMNLLTDLLNWARAQSGRLEYNPKDFDLVQLVHNIHSLVDHNMKQKDQKFELVCPEKATVFADKFMIETIIRNILSNAMKFTANGGNIKITIEKSGYDKFNCSIIDNGVGIPEDKINEIFRIDSNYSTNGTNKEKGTGLGLVLCREFIQINKGDIMVESKQGIGSKFTISIPISKN